MTLVYCANNSNKIMSFNRKNFTNNVTFYPVNIPFFYSAIGKSEIEPFKKTCPKPRCRLSSEQHPIYKSTSN